MRDVDLEKLVIALVMAVGEKKVEKYLDYRTAAHVYDATDGRVFSDLDFYGVHEFLVDEALEHFGRN